MKKTNRKTGDTKFPSREWVRKRRNDLLFLASEAEKAARNIIILLGYKITPQKPIFTGRKIYFADIFINELNTIVEIDGGYHRTGNQERLDRNRSAGLWRLGYHVVRLTNKDARDPVKIKAKIDYIKAKIRTS